jgi:hypothetical protein
MKLDRKLNLVWLLEREEGVVHVHSTPISKAIWDRYYKVISRTYIDMLENGGLWMAQMGVRVARMSLEDTAKTMGVWEGKDGVQQGLMNEITRLTNVIVPLEGSWDSVPMQEAIDKGFFEEDERSEVENAICFFTVCYASMPKNRAQEMLEMISDLFGAVLTSSNATEYQSSLPT